jgi:neutral ceramidase
MGAVMASRLKACRYAVCLVLLLGLVPASGRLQAEELKAGVATVDITPPLELNSPLGGYGERMNRPAEGVHDRIFAKALVVSAGTRKFALITADLLGFPPPIKPVLVESLKADGWTSGQLMLLASHSHTSIEMNAIHTANTIQVPQIGIFNSRVYEFLMPRLAQVVRDAEKSLTPVTIGTSSSDLQGWNRNRRGGALVDPELTVTRIDTTADKPLAVLVNFTAHPTFMSAEDMLFSGDWPGHLQRTLESLIGDGVTAMYYNGAEGDQAPIARFNSGDSHWERAERYGRDLGIVAWRQWEVTKTAPNAVLACHLQHVQLPERTWHPDFKKTGGEEYGLDEKLLTEMLPKLFPAETDLISLRLGDLVIVGIPGEMAAKLGLEIKSQTEQITGAKHAVIGGLADAWLSYILPAEEYLKGGYETSVSFYGPKLGETIAAGALAGVKRLGK